MVALCIVFLMVAAAFGVDLGTLMAQKRKMQSVADLVAMDTVRLVNGGKCSDLQTDGLTLVSDMNAAATASALRNNFTVGGTNVLNVEPGTWSSGTFTSFGTNCTTTPAGVPSGVRITAQGTTKYGFAKVVGISSGTTHRNAVAARTMIGSFMIGSDVAAVDSSQSTLLNPLLTGLYGGSANSVNLSLVGYQGLAATDVTLGALATQLGFGSTTALLASNVNVKNLLTAEATLLSLNCVGSNTYCTAAASLNGIAAAINSTNTLKLGNLISVATGSESAAAVTSVNVLGLLTGSAQIINGTSAVTLNNVAVTIPGVTSTKVTLNLIEPPVIYIGPVGGSTRLTAQATLTVTPTINLPVGLPPLVGTVLTGNLPITVTGGGAKGTLEAAQCDGASAGITVGADVQAAASTIAGNLGLSATVLFVNLQVANVAVNGTGVASTVGHFDPAFAYPGDFGSTGPPPVAPTTTHVGNTTIGLGTLTTGTVTASVIGGLVTLPVNTNAILGTALGTVLSAVDTSIVQPILKGLGLDIGAADVTPLRPISCSTPALMK
jgi:uncharacterized membrane protein